jgi:hypothetical protein
MIRHAITVSELRFYADDNAGPMADYDASCMVVWETPFIVWIRMLRGGLSRALLRNLLEWLVNQGIVTVRAHRAAGHVLPLAKEQPDGSYSTDVQALAARFLRPNATSDWTPL